MNTTNPSVLFRSLIVYAICVPLAILDVYKRQAVTSEKGLMSCLPKAPAACSVLWELVSIPAM